MLWEGEGEGEGEGALQKERRKPQETRGGESILLLLLLGRRRKRYVWKVVILFFSIALCTLALLKLHFYYSYYYFYVNHLSSSGYRLPNSHLHGPPPPPPRIAFLFLAKRHLPLDFFWSPFFQNAEQANFSIYIHSAPGFKFNESTTRSHFFYGRQLNNSIQVAWGESSMIEAERLLLAAALEEPSNQRFVLLSDSCVPLYNFSYIYKYLMSSPKSFVDSFLDVKESRYNRKMSPAIPFSKWRKGSQWIALIRKHAELIVDDDNVFPVFQKHCKKLQKQHNCIPDEHYVQTMLSMNELDSELERRTLTYTEWSQSAMKMDKKAWHPMTFTYGNASPQKIKEIKDIRHVYYESELRTEWCQTNSVLVPCFLFARKFSRGAAMRLLSEGVVRTFDTVNGCQLAS